eukprot:346016_1
MLDKLSKYNNDTTTNMSKVLDDQFQSVHKFTVYKYNKNEKATLEKVKAMAWSQYQQQITSQVIHSFKSNIIKLKQHFSAELVENTMEQAIEEYLKNHPTDSDLIMKLVPSIRDKKKRMRKQ